jgi:hypothetical protein
VRLRPAWIQTSLRIRAVWSGSMLLAIRLSTCYMVCNRTAWIRLVWIHAGRKRTLLVFSWRGSFIFIFHPYTMMANLYTLRVALSIAIAQPISLSYIVFSFCRQQNTPNGALSCGALSRCHPVAWYIYSWAATGRQDDSSTVRQRAVWHFIMLLLATTRHTKVFQISQYSILSFFLF